MLLDCSVGTVCLVSVTVAVAEGFVTVVAVCLEGVRYSADFYHCSHLPRFLYFCKWGS